ncbi:MAG: YraN family protein [Smithella sp.]|nr:YraN family protein [Smithella sp.]
MKNPNKTTGEKGEFAAVSYLKQNGYQILETNYRCAIGEIDVIARENNELVFVEVKTRKSGEMGYPEEAVGIKKQKKMSQLALWYLQNEAMNNANARFDVIAITVSGSKNEIRLIKNAFDFIS